MEMRKRSVVSHEKNKQKNSNVSSKIAQEICGCHDISIATNNLFASPKLLKLFGIMQKKYLACLTD